MRGMRIGLVSQLSGNGTSQAFGSSMRAVGSSRRRTS